MLSEANSPSTEGGAPATEKAAWDDTLIALVEKGPLWDGDVPSKSQRDALIAKGFASRAIIRGEDGYTVATYQGRERYCQIFGEPSFAKAKERRQQMQEEAKLDRDVERAMRALRSGPWHRLVDGSFGPEGEYNRVRDSVESQLAADDIIVTLQLLHDKVKHSAQQG